MEKEVLIKWLNAHVGECIEIHTKTHERVHGIILAVDSFGNVELESEDFGDSILIQRSDIGIARPYRG